jgi:hypothetical protein
MLSRYTIEALSKDPVWFTDLTEFVNMYVYVFKFTDSAAFVSLHFS